MIEWVETQKLFSKFDELLSLTRLLDWLWQCSIAGLVAAAVITIPTLSVGGVVENLLAELAVIFDAADTGPIGEAAGCLAKHREEYQGGLLVAHLRRHGFEDPP